MSTEPAEPTRPTESTDPKPPHRCPSCGHEFVESSVPPKGRTDGRQLGEWESRYPAKAARQGIRLEAIYVAGAQAMCVLLTAVLLLNYHWLLPMVDKDEATTLGPFALSYLGGFFGGTLFAMKWLYHSVARGLWNQDRRLWRLYTPFLSGGAALALVLLSSTSVVPIFGPEVMANPAATFGISIVLGYFSDKVFSALEGFAKQNLNGKAQSG